MLAISWFWYFPFRERVNWPLPSFENLARWFFEFYTAMKFEDEWLFISWLCEFPRQRISTKVTNTRLQIEKFCSYWRFSCLLTQRPYDNFHEMKATEKRDLAAFEFVCFRFLIQRQLKHSHKINIKTFFGFFHLVS